METSLDYDRQYRSLRALGAQRGAWRSGGLAASVALSLAGSGCSLDEVDSDAIRTQGLYADMLALASGDGTTLVRVDLTVGGDNGTTVNLVGDDELVASAGGPPGSLSRTGRGRYEIRIMGDEAREVTVELLRGAEDDPAGASVSMPEPLVLALDTDDGAGIPRDAGVRLSWEPAVAGGRVNWSVQGRCIWTESGVTPDDGLLELAPDVFRVRSSRIGEECGVLVTLERENRGSVDAVLVPGSKFVARQRRGIDFISTPGADELAGGEPEGSEPEGSEPEGSEPAPDAGS